MMKNGVYFIVIETLGSRVIQDFDLCKFDFESSFERDDKKFRVMGTLNSSSIDELGKWCYQRLVGAPRKYQAQQGGFVATL